MKTLAFAWRQLLREGRAGELAVLTAALAIAVGSVTAIGFLTDRIGQAVAQQAAEVLAADLRLDSPEALDASWAEAAEAAGLATARILSFPSVVYAGDDSALASVRAVTDGYPLRGRMRIADRLLATPRVADAIPAPGEVWLETGVLARLGVDVGARVELGAATFTVAQVLTYRPDQSPGFSGLAPALIMNLADVPATELLADGSRVRHALLIAGPRGALRAYAQTVEDTLPPGVRLRDRGDAGRELNASIERASRFLALASLVSLLLAAVAVAMSARRYAQRRLDTAALLKSLGASQRFVVSVSLLQLLLIGLVASVLGAALGFAVERGVASALAGWLRSEMPTPSWRPLALGAGTALILLVGFALPSVLRLARTPPLRVLRHDLDPPPPGAFLTYGLAVAALGALVYWSVRDLTLLTVIVGGTFVTGAVLYGAGRLLVRVLASRRGGVGVAWRYGLANVARRGANSAIQIVAFGLGLMVLLVLTLVRNDLLAGWRTTLDTEAPNHFLINIQGPDRAGIAALLEDAGVAAPQFVPLVRARLTHVNDTPANERDGLGERGERLSTRGQNLTWLDALPATNTLVEGRFWAPGHDGGNEVSVEIEAAEAMAVGLGDRLRFTVAGEEVEATVTSLREVDWESFEPNFFMIFSPNALRDYPQSFISSLRVSDAQRPALLELVRAYPSVSIIDIEAVLDQVRAIIDKAALAVQLVFAFTLAAGLVVLFAAVQSTLDERRYESAILRTFGARRRTVFAGLAAEFAALGLAAGLFAALGASAVGALAAQRLFDLNYAFDPGLWLVGLVSGVTIVGISGVLAARGAVDTPPVQTLRRTM